MKRKSHLCSASATGTALIATVIIIIALLHSILVLIQSTRKQVSYGAVQDSRLVTPHSRQGSASPSAAELASSKTAAKGAAYQPPKRQYCVFAGHQLLSEIWRSFTYTAPSC